MYDVAIISAPRNPATIGQMLQSYWEVFDVKPYVFEEPGILGYVGRSKVHPIVNNQTLGCFWNWLSTLQFMLKETKNPFIVICEDDIIFQDSAKDAIAEIVNTVYDETYSSLQKHNTLISPYCALVNQPKNTEWQISNTKKYGLCGSLCIIMPRQVAAMIAEKQQVFIDHAKNKEGKSLHLDTAIGKICKDLSINIVTHNPTLVQHIGHTSTWLSNNGPIPLSMENARKPAL